MSHNSTLASLGVPWRTKRPSSSILHASPAVQWPWKEVLFSILLLALLTLAFLLITRTELLGDEGAHMDQIKEMKDFFTEGKQITFHHPTFPTFHSLVALFSLATGLSSPAFYRAVAFALNCAAVLAVLRFSWVFQRSAWHLKTLQVVFFPLVFPFLFFIYTDIPSLLPVLLSVYFTLRRRNRLAGLFSILGVLMRQTNIFWLAFNFLLLFALRYGWAITPSTILTHLRRNVLFVIGFVLFGLFVLWNGGIALADRGSHPLSFSWGNITLSLFLFFILFLPLHIANIPRILSLIRRRWMAILLLSIPLLVFFLLTFTHDHPYNGDTWWLRNRLLTTVAEHWYWKAAFFLGIALSLLSLIVTKLQRKEFALLFPFTLLALGSSWLIEPRYAIVPFVLFILFQEKQYIWVHISTTLLFIAASLTLFHGALLHLYLP